MRIVAPILLAVALPASAQLHLHLDPGTVDGCPVSLLTVTDTTISVTCATAPPNPPPIICTGKSSGQFNVNSTRKTPNVPASGSVAYTMAVASVPGKFAKYQVVGMPGGFTGKVTAAFSECPQDFDHPPYPSIYCAATGTTAGFYIRGDSYTTTPTYNTSCPLLVGKQYYVSFKVEGCTTPTCSFFVDYYGNFSTSP